MTSFLSYDQFAFFECIRYYPLSVMDITNARLFYVTPLLLTPSLCLLWITMVGCFYMIVLLLNLFLLLIDTNTRLFLYDRVIAFPRSPIDTNARLLASTRLCYCVPSITL